MSNEKHETIADIVADIRAQNQGLPEDSYALSTLVCDLLSFADRIEAAAKREREAGAEAAQVFGEIGEMIGMEATREKSSRVGNAAKMREALVKAKKAICHHAKYVCQSLSLENSDIQSNCGDILCAHRDLCEAKTAINAALSSPPRNCDVGTAEEQNRRFCKWCRKYGIDGDMEVACAHQDMSCTLCALRWAQMPYEEG